MPSASILFENVPKDCPHNGSDHRAGTSDLVFNWHAQVRLRVHHIVIHRFLPVQSGQEYIRQVQVHELENPKAIHRKVCLIFQA